MYNFEKAKFFITVDNYKDLPKSNGEVAFVGRSNCGKSSLINTLTNQKKLAFTSKTPGRTQHINFFEFNDNLFLVDLPGYGYAKVPDSKKNHWESLLSKYFQTREELLGMILIMDIRHPLKELDFKMLDFFRNAQKPIHIVLSKSDKLSKEKQQISFNKVQSTLINQYANISIQLFSSLKKIGITELQEKLKAFFY